MKVRVSCAKNPKLCLDRVVYTLVYDFADKFFYMPLCVGDDWCQRVNCTLTPPPLHLYLQWDLAFVNFAQEQDALAFADWLAEAELKVQEGFRTRFG